MALTINNNIAAQKADSEITRKTRAVDSNFEKLSSGKRITKASDDAAGLAILAALSSNVDTAGVASRNISDAVSLTDIAEGGLQSASEITGRLSELATQAANGTLSDAQRGSLQQEADSLVAELDRISQTTQFNGQQLLNSGSSVTIQAGTDGSSSSQISVSLVSVSSSSLNLNNFNISTAQSAQNSLSNAKAATESLASAQGEIGEASSRLSSAFDVLQTQRLNESSAASRIGDVDVAEESARLAANKIGQQAGVAVAAQANQDPRQVLNLLR